MKIRSLCPFYGTASVRKFIQQKEKKQMLNGCLKKRKEAGSMKGYVVDSGYMGYVDGRYELFADESDYMEVYKEMQG